MPDVIINEGTPVVSTETTPEIAADAIHVAEIKAMLLGVGPKEVRTPNMTVIAHDPKQIQQLLERRSTTAPTMCSLGGCVGVPKAAAYRGFAADYDPSVD